MTGAIDLFAVTMSLKCGVKSEVSYALNILNVLANACRTSGYENGLNFSLAQCDDLLETMLDVLEETAFGHEEDEEEVDVLSDDEELDGMPANSGHSRSPPARSPWLQLRTHVELYNYASERELALHPQRARIDGKKVPVQPLPPSDVILSLLATLRTFSMTDGSVKLLSHSSRLHDLLLRLCNFRSTSSPSDATYLPTVELSPTDLLTVRKDVIAILAEIGLEVRLSPLSARSLQSLYDLFYFFLAEPASHDQPGMQSSDGSALREGFLNVYTDLALTAFARVALPDANRELLAQAAGSHRYVVDLFDGLLRLFPLSDSDFSAVIASQGEAGIVLEKAAMCLFNLAAIAPADVKRRWRCRPGLHETLMRTVAQFMPAHPESFDQNPYGTLVLRLLETLAAIGGSGSDGEGDTFALDAPFFGGGFAGAAAAGATATKTTSPDRALATATRPEDLPVLTSAVSKTLVMLRAKVVNRELARLLTKLIDMR